MPDLSACPQTRLAARALQRSSCSGDFEGERLHAQQHGSAQSPLSKRTVVLQLPLIFHSKDVWTLRALFCGLCNTQFARGEHEWTAQTIAPHGANSCCNPHSSHLTRPRKLENNLANKQGLGKSGPGNGLVRFLVCSYFRHAARIVPEKVVYLPWATSLESKARRCFGRGAIAVPQ